MDRKLSRLLESGLAVAFVFLIIFAGVSAVMKQYVVAAVELFVVILLFIFYRRRAHKRATDIRKYVENLAFQMDDASKMSLVNFPLPMVIIRVDSGEIVWSNKYFVKIASLKEHLFEMRIDDIVSNFDSKWLMEGRQICPRDITLGNKKYNLYGNIVNSDANDGRTLLATLFFVDITEYDSLRIKHDKSRPTVAIIVVDSYEELYKGMTESEKSKLTAEIDNRLTAWAQPTGGIIRKLDRDRYLFVFEQQDYIDLAAAKFSVLDSMRTVKNSQGITATLSIGIGRGGENFAELYQFAALGIDMALSRGGDQVVIKTRNNYEFFGGKSKQVEKRTKVKARVTANALRQLIRDSDDVFITGHKISDLDCIGAAAGLCAAIRVCGKKAYIIADENKSSAKELIRQLKAEEHYKEIFISEQEAMLIADAQSLCIVVDTCRPELVEAEELLQAVNRVALIDHHRRAANYIDNPAISLHETATSSTSELVTELIQNIVTPRDMLKIEAEALLSGIVLDTKSFSMRTGVRTFEAAAYLRQIGADTLNVKRMFSGDMSTYMKKFNLISNAKEIFKGVSLAVSDTRENRIVAAQAADELMNIAGMKAAFVIFGDGEGSAVSARSYGQMNVQVVMEKVGGGGSLDMAGAQFADKKPHEVEGLIRGAIEEYINELESSEKAAKEDSK